MDRPFLYWRDELARDAENGLVEIDCSKKNKDKFVKAIMSMLTTADDYFVKNGLYAYNDYYKFLDEKFMDRFEYELLYPKFVQDNSFEKEGLSGACEFGDYYYDNIKISRQNLFDKATICHEFVHYLTLNNFYHSHKKDGRFKVFVNSAENEHHMVFKNKHMTKPATLSENAVHKNQFFIEGLTQYLTEQIYPTDKGSVYVAQVKMIGLLCDLIGQKNILGDFLQGNVDSIEKYFDAKTWDGKYIGNFADFLKFTQAYFDDSENSKSYYLFRDINKNYKGAIKCIVYAYYQNLLKDSKKHSAEEFMKLFEFCIDYGALPECYQLFKKIANSGKIENLDGYKDKINKMCKCFAIDHQDCKFKVGDFVLEVIYGADCINFVLNLGKNNQLNLKFDGVDGFDNDLNNHSQTYLQSKARATKFANGKKAQDMSITVEGNAVKVVFFDKTGQEMHSVCINYGHKKNAMFDDCVVDFDYDGGHTEREEVL